MRVLFIGTGEIGVPVLRSLLSSTEHELVGVVTQPDKPVGRAQRMQAPPIKQAMAGLEIPVLQPARIKSADAVSEIHALAPEVIVVMAYGQILPRSVLEIPRVACLNLHASLLPRHRGAAPVQAAIFAGDRESGITVLVGRSATGPAFWTEVQWEATRDASRAVRYVVEVAPGLYPAFEPAVRLLAAWPLWLVAESLAGLALAWHGHALIARTPLSAAGLNH